MRYHFTVLAICLCCKISFIIYIYKITDLNITWFFCDCIVIFGIANFSDSDCIVVRCYMGLDGVVLP